MSGQPDTYVEYGTNKERLNHFALGNKSLFVDGGSLHTQRFVHSTKATGLKQNRTYFYRVGDPKYTWSDIFQFTTFPNGKFEIDIAVYGDFVKFHGNEITNPGSH